MTRPHACLVAVATVAITTTAALAQSAAPTQLSRAQVRAELQEAQRSGDLVTQPDSGLTARETIPGRYPAHESAPGLSRQAVRSELVEAQRSGDLVTQPDSGLTARETIPGRYPAHESEPGLSRQAVKGELDQTRTSGAPAAYNGN